MASVAYSQERRYQTTKRRKTLLFCSLETVNCMTWTTTYIQGVRAREPASFWRENVMAIVILLRVYGSTGLRVLVLESKDLYDHVELKTLPASLVLMGITSLAFPSPLLLNGTMRAS